MGKVGTQNDATRTAWVEHALSTLAAESRILDAGAGQQKYRQACGHLRYVAQDFAQYQPGEQDASGLHVPKWDYGKLDIISDITAIPESDGSFDAILCTEVLEHIPDPRAAVREFARLLRDGGTLLLTAPFCSLTHFAPYHFSTGFSRFFYEKILAEYGFEIVEITPNGNYFEFLAQEIGRLPAVSWRYTGLRRGWLMTLSQKLMLKVLARLSKADKGSAELLCFGYHIRAVRKHKAAMAA